VAAKEASTFVGLLLAVIAFVGKSKSGEFVPAFGHIHQLMRMSMCLLLFVKVASLQV
jgi:hypothetical protein